MSNEQFKLMMDALLRIIELLEKLDKPQMVSVVNQRGLTGYDSLLNSFNTSPIAPRTDAIGKPLSKDDVS